MLLYYVERVGVFSQGVYGIFDSKEKAKIACKKAKQKEKDNYHGFSINTRKLNEESYDDIKSDIIIQF